MASDKRLINPCGFHDAAIDGSYPKRPPLTVGDRHQSVARELHRDRAARKIVGTILAPQVKSANRRPAMGIARGTALMVVVVEWQPADGVNPCRAVRAVTDVHCG